jgi:protoporphyrin/coproporphyrin ferrochelatase
MARKVAVVLFNLGGPNGPDDVQPFLRNLFRDPAIIGAPSPIREILAWFISTTRAPSARKNYELMGGGSPLLRESEKQAEALIAQLSKSEPGTAFRSFIAMRYWNPFIEECVTAVKAWKADEIVLLPFYPQFSTSTTGSSLSGWKAAGGPEARIVCCYPEAIDFIEAHADLIRNTWKESGASDRSRLLFSAHGLPKRTVEQGDPYQWQIEQTCRAVAARLPELNDWEICYQSRVGPLEWIGPSTEAAIEQAAQDEKDIILTPIAFVSEHIETLVELDEEYGELAREKGVQSYQRVPALGISQGYIKALAKLTLDALNGPCGLKPPCGERLCPAEFGKCPNRIEANV